jgi:hypothetical protein
MLNSSTEDFMRPIKKIMVKAENNFMSPRVEVTTGIISPVTVKGNTVNKRLNNNFFSFKEVS